MKVAIGADHAGFEVKERLKAHLVKEGFEVRDLGTHSPESTDYPDFAYLVAHAVARGEAERGVLVCGSGIGMSIAANKVPGARAALVTDEWLAEMCRRHNDANVICLASRMQAAEALERFTEKFLKTPFDGGRHQKRVAKMTAIEQGKNPV